MVEGEMTKDVNMEQFLADRRINLGQLSKKVQADGGESAADRAKRQREFAVAKRVSINT